MSHCCSRVCRRRRITVTHHSLCALFTFVFFASCLFSFLEKQKKQLVASSIWWLCFQQSVSCKDIKEIYSRDRKASCYMLLFVHKPTCQAQLVSKKKKGQANTSNSIEVFLFCLFFFAVLSLVGISFLIDEKEDIIQHSDFMISRLNGSKQADG